MKNSFSQNLQNSQIRNSSIRPLQSLKEESKLSTLKLNKNGNSQSVKRINILEFKQNVQKELEMQKKKLEEMYKKDLQPVSQDYFSNVYGPLTNKVNSIKQLRQFTQRNKDFDEAHFAFGCPCFHHGQKKNKVLFADQSWFNGITEKPQEREMMPNYLDSIVSDIYDDIPIDEGILVGEVNLFPIKKKKGKMNMLRERFNEVIIDENYPDIEKLYKIMGQINKPSKGKIAHFSMFEIEAGEIINFEFENKGILSGKQYQNKIDYQEMSQFYLEIIFLEKDNVQDILSVSRPSSASSNSDMSTQLSRFCCKKQSHFQLQLKQKYRHTQFSYDAIEALRQLKITDPIKLYRIITTYDPVYQESIISLSIIIRDIPLMNFLFTEIFTDQNLTSNQGFFKYASIEIFNGFQKVSFRFEKDKKFFLELQKRLVEQQNIQLSDFFFIKDKQLDYTPTYGSEGNQFSLILRQRSKSYSAILSQFCDFKNLSELEFSSKIFEKLMMENQQNIDNVDLSLEYYRDLYFNKFVLPDKFENNKFQSIYFGNSKIAGGRKFAKENNSDIRYHNILHSNIENRQNLDDIIRRYDETFVLFSQKDLSGNTPGQLLFKRASSDQILEYIKQAGQDQVKQFMNDQGENILHSLYLNVNLINSEDILSLLGQDIVNQLKNQKNNSGQYPLIYFLRRNIRRIRFSTLNLLFPNLREQGDSVQFIRNELLPIINSCSQNSEVMQFLINKIGSFQIIYKYPPAINKFFEIKPIYERLMQNLFDDEYHLMQGYQYMNQRQLQWVIEKDRSLIHKMMKMKHPVYDWYVRKRQEGDTQYQDNSVLVSKKIKKKQGQQNIIKLSLIKQKQRDDEVLKSTEPLPKNSTENLNYHEIKWSNKILFPNQDREITKYFSRLLAKNKQTRQYSAFQFDDYQVQKYFFCNLETYHAKKHILFEKLKKLDKNFIFHFKQNHSNKNSEFILDLDKLGFFAIVEIKARPFARYMEDQPNIQKQKWFQTKDEFKKLMIQKHCNHLTNIPFYIAKDDNNKVEFAKLLERLSKSQYMADSLLELFLYYIIEGSASENLRSLSNYYFDLNSFLRWCRVLRINPSTSMIQVILDENLIPHNKLVQMLCFRRYNHQLIEQNILANLDINQIQITEEKDNENNNKSDGQKKKLKVSQMLFDVICVKAKVKNFTKSYEWAQFMIESSLTNKSRMSKQNKRYIFSQNWPDLWMKLNDSNTHAAVLYFELNKKLKEKKQYKTNNSNPQQQNSKNSQQGENQSILITNKDYFKKCIEALSSKIYYRHLAILSRIIMLCIELGKPKWGQKILAYSSVYQQKIFQLLRFYNINLLQYKLVFQQQSFISKDKQQNLQLENLKYLFRDMESQLTLKKLEKNDQYGQIQQWIQRVSEEFRYELAHFFIMRYLQGLLVNQESSASRKQIKTVYESLASEKFRKKQQEYSQKLEQLMEKSQKKITKFQKEHSYNLLSQKEEPNKEKQGYYKVNIPQNKNLKVLFGSPVLLNTNAFQIEQLFDTCLEIYYSQDDFYVQNPDISYKQFLKKYKAMKKEKLGSEEYSYLSKDKELPFVKISKYLYQRPDKVIGILQKMKHNTENYIRNIFSILQARRCKKFNENIEYLSSKLIIKEYISNESAIIILQSCLTNLFQFNNNPIISSIVKNFGKEILFQTMAKEELSVDKMKNILPTYLIDCMSWIKNQDSKSDIKKSGDQKNDNFDSELDSANFGSPDLLNENQTKERIQNQSKDKGNQEDSQIEQQKKRLYSNILIELVKREVQRLKIQKYFKKQQNEGSKNLEISQFKSDLLNFELANVISEIDFNVMVNPSPKRNIKFADYILKSGLLIKGDEVDERLIQFMQSNPDSKIYILKSQDPLYAKIVFDKLYQGKRSLVEEFMDQSKLFYEMIVKGYKEDFIEKMISYYYRKSSDSIKLVELSIQNNMQKVFFSLIRSESDRNQIKQTIQNQYQYIKAFRHYDILNFAINELEIQQFNSLQKQQQKSNQTEQIEQDQVQSDDEEKTFLLEIENCNWLSMKLLLAQENQLEKFNKTQKMFIMLKNLLLENLISLPCFLLTKKNISTFIQLSELVFDKSKLKNYSSELAIIQSEILKSQILHLPQSFEENSTKSNDRILDQLSQNKLVIEHHEYNNPYGYDNLHKILIKPYQIIYWLKYRHGLSTLSFQQAKEEEFVAKVKDIVNKFGPLQIEFNAKQAKLGVYNDVWLYEYILRNLDVNKDENYLYQLANLLNPMNSTFSYFMFNIAIYNTELFIRLIPKLKQVFNDKQIEELLSIYIKIHLKLKVREEKVQLTEYIQNYLITKSKNSTIQSSDSNELDAEQQINQDLDSEQQADIAPKQKQDQPSQNRNQDDILDDNQDFSQIYFQDLKQIITEYSKLYRAWKISRESGQPIKLSVPIEFQNAFIILIKCFNSNLYSKILCDTLTSLDQTSILNLKTIVFILDHANQNTQAKCIKQLANFLQINIKNCQDIRQFEQIVHFYDEHVSKLLFEPYNVKRIEIIIGNANKYQYFSSQNMILTINYINVQEFQNFVFKEFEFTKNIQFIPFDNIKMAFNLKLSSKNFGSNQTKTQIVNEYFEKQFQQEIHQEEYYFRNWCQTYALIQRAQLRNYDIAAQSFIDKPKTDQEYDQIINIKLSDEIEQSQKQNSSKQNKQKIKKIIEKIENIGTSLYAREVNLIAKEIQSSEYAKLLTPYERIKNMQGQLFLEKEMKNENTYFVYFYFESNKTHIINTFYLTNIYLQKILDQNQIQASLPLNAIPIQQPFKFIRQFEQQNYDSDFFYDFDFEINQESIILERNQNLANLYSSRYLKYEMNIGLQQHWSSKEEFKKYVKLKYKLDDFKIKFICFDGNEEQADSIFQNLEQDQQDQTIKLALIFDFSAQPIKVVNQLFKQYDQRYYADNNLAIHSQPAFLTQFHSIFDVYRHYCVIDFISYFNTLIMNCSQLKLMYSYIPSQIQKVIQIISSNAHKYGFIYVMFKFTTTNQPFNLKSDCFKDHSDKIIRLGQTTYEVYKPLEDNDSQKFKLPYQILKVTLSLAFKHPTKEFTAPEKKDDDIEHYFYKIANEYDLIKSVCQNRDILKKLFQEQNADSKKPSKSKKTLKNSEEIERSRKSSQNGDQIDENKNTESVKQNKQENENKALSLQKLDQIIPQIFENNLKNQNDIYLYYNQVFQKIKELETYFLLYKNVDLDNYKQTYYDEVYNKYLLDLIVQQKGKDLKDFYRLQTQARKWVKSNTVQLQKEFLSIINQPIKPSSQQAYKYLTYQFNKNQAFQIVYPSQKISFSLIQSKIMEFKINISSILSEYNVTYKGEDKWNSNQWNAIFDSCEGLRDANSILNYEKFMKQHKFEKKQKNWKTKNKYENKQIKNLDEEDIQKLQLSNYFSNIQLVFTEVVSNNSQNQDKEKKQNSSDNVKVYFKYQDESTSKENKTLVLESISTSQLVRQDTALYVLRSLVNEIKNDLSNQVYSPQQENNRQKVMRITVMVDQKQEQYKFKKKIFEMNQQELIQVFYFITLINYYKKLANQVKKPIKLTFQTGLKKPIIQESQSYFKIKMSTFQTINMYQLIIQDSEKPRPKCGLYSINCLTYLKTETVSDITTVNNWSLELLLENQNKFSIKTVEVKQADIDPQGQIKFQFEDNSQFQPIYVKFIYKKQIVAVYLKKQESSQ